MKSLRALVVLMLLFTSSNLLFGQDVSLQIQVGGSEEVFQGIGSCFLANGYQVYNNMPSEINFEDNQVTVNQFGSVQVRFTISVPLSTPPGVYNGNIIYEIYQTGGSFCFADTLKVEVDVIPALLPEPDFSASPEAIIEGGIVQFTNLTENTVTEWLWEFGDGDTSTLKNPSHVYTAPGTYTVSLQATGPAGSATETKTDFIQVFEAGTPGQQFWAFQTGEEILSSPAIGADGTIYIGSNDGALYALNPDGTVKWVFEVGYNNTRTPVIGHNGVIYVLNSVLNRIYAVNPDGTEKWMYQAMPDNGSIIDRFALGLDGTIYFGTNKGWLQAIDSLSNDLWSVSLGTTSVSSLAIGTDGIIYSAISQGNDDKLIAISLDGTVKWESEAYPGFGNDVNISISNSGNIYIVHDKIFAFNRGGDLLWQVPPSPQSFQLNSEAVFDADGNIYTGGTKAGNTSILYSLNPTGQINWEIDVSSYIPTFGSSNDQSTPIIGNDGNIYFYVKGGVVFCVSKTGSLIWSLPIVPNGFEPNNFEFHEAPAMGSDGTIYFGYDDGKVHAISSVGGGLSDSWSKQGQNNFNTRSYLCPFPYLDSPADSSQDLSLSPTFNWTSVFLASEYEIQLSKSEDFSSDVISQTTSDIQIQFVGIDYGEYYWKVRPILENGEVGCWSTVWHFTTIPPPPTQPELLSPPDGSVDIPLMTSFSWNDVLGAETYRIQISEDDSFSSLIVEEIGLLDTNFEFALPGYEKTYYWRVRASNSTGDSDWSATWSFTTVIAPPTQPELLSPPDGSVDIPLMTSFSWNDVSGAETYRIQISEDDSFSSLIVEEIGLLDTNFDFALPGYETTYYWRVRASNSTGDSDWSATWSFTTVIAPPAQPELLSPPDGSVDIPLMTSFSWNDVSGAETYRIQISEDDSFSSLIVEEIGLLDTNFDFALPGYETTYYWRVRASNSTGDSDWSATWSFTTVIAPPTQPELLSPPDGSVGIPLMTSFSWTDVSGAETYRIQISEDDSFSSLIAEEGGLLDTNFDFALPGYETTYYWRVRASNSTGDSDWSAAWSFKTVIAPPTQPELLSPLDGSVDIPLMTSFSWNDVPGAETYRIQISEDDSFSSLIVEEIGLLDTNFDFALPGYETTYYWRVRASNSTGDSDWSATWSFTTVITPPTQPELLSPPDGSVDIPLMTSFSWNDVSGAETYRIQISEDDSFSSLIVEEIGLLDTNFDFTLPGYETTYYWRVRASNSTGDSDWSATWSFKTVIAPPTQPELLSPLDGSVDIPLMTSFSWNDVPGAETYRIQISEDDSFSSLIVEEIGLLDTNFDFTLPGYETTYYWRVRASNSTGDSDWSATWSFTTEIMTGTEELAANYKFIIFPNPSNGDFIIQSNKAFGQVQLNVVNALGQQVWSEDWDMATESEKHLQLTHLPAGVYWIAVVQGGRQIGRKIIVQ